MNAGPHAAGRTGSPAGRAWIRGAALVLGAEGLLAILYGPLLPTPIAAEVALSVPLLGRLTLFWVVVALARLIAAGGVAMAARWGRALAVVVATPAFIVSAAGVAGAFLRLGLVDLVSDAVSLGLDGLVLFAVTRRWPAPAPRARGPQRTARQARSRR